LSLRVQDVDFMRRRCGWSGRSRREQGCGARRRPGVRPGPCRSPRSWLSHCRAMLPSSRPARTARCSRPGPARRMRTPTTGHASSPRLLIAPVSRRRPHNAALVLSTYGHLMPDSEDRTRRAVDSAWAACAPSVPHEEGAGR
jgi:hypothetical protein